MQATKSLVLLIPGNPSVPGIYDPFLNQVIEDLNLHGEVVSKVLPHLGQCNQRSMKFKNVRVQDVIADHKKTIKILVEENRPQRVILIGHSLGSAVTICLYRDLSNIVDKFIIVCPFLGPSPNNEKYLKLFQNPITRLGMKGITYSGLKIHKISHQVFKTWLGENPFNEHIPREIRKPYYIKNFFSLVSNYFTDFEELNLKERVKEMDPKKSFFIFAPNDYWVPEETVHHLPESSYFFQCPDINHDFCLRKEQYQSVSKAITSHLLKEMKSESI